MLEEKLQELQEQQGPHTSVSITFKHLSEKECHNGTRLISNQYGYKLILTEVAMQGSTFKICMLQILDREYL